MGFRKAALSAVLAVSALGLILGGTASAIPNGTTQTVDSVLVNKTGGITASGTVDCTAEVTAYFAPNPIPADTMVLVNESWTASQRIGRKTMLQATYGSNYANQCFDNTASSSGAPYPWMTSQFNSTDTPFYVYSPDGAFKKGAIHVDLTSEGGYLIVNGQFVGQITDVFAVTGFDLKATRA